MEFVLLKFLVLKQATAVLEGTGRICVGDETLTLPTYGRVLVGPDQLRQVFNDAD